MAARDAAHPADRARPALAMLALVFNAFTWGLSWWPFRRLQEQGLHPVWVTALCFWVAVAVLLTWRPRALGLLLRTPALWLLVLASGLTNASFNWAVTIGDVVRVVLLFYLMPLWTVLLSRAVLGERVGQAGAWRVAMALAGAAVVLWPASDGTPRPATPLADGLALLGGFCFALNNVLLRREAHRDESARALAMFGGGAGVATLVALTLSQQGLAPWPPTPGWGWMASTLALALWFLAANLTLQYGAARLPANTTSVVLVTAVVFASLSSAAMGAGTLDTRSLLGAVLIVGAAVLAAWRSH